MRTIAYVDGYNLYYGCLKNTPYKWLDLFRLIEQILNIQNPNAQLVQVKYFTAPVKAKISSRGEQAAQAQSAYHRALESRGVEIHQGWHSLERGYALEYVPDTPPNKATRVPIWRLEEKETDVGLALHLYSDALHARCDQVVLISSDTDLRLAFVLLERDAPGVMRGLIYPRTESCGRPPNQSLAAVAHWVRGEIKTAELSASQLPNRVPTRKKPVIKPDYW